MERELAEKLAVLENMVRDHPDWLLKRLQYIIDEKMAREDLAQEALLRAVQGIKDFRGQAEAEQLCPWMAQIARNLSYNYLRDRGRRPPSASLERTGETQALACLPDDGADPAHLISQKEMHARLVALVQALPEDYRTVFLLREIEQLSTRTTARVLGISEDLVKWRLRRARALLRQQLA